MEPHLSPFLSLRRLARTGIAALSAGLLLLGLGQAGAEVSPGSAPAFNEAGTNRASPWVVTPALINRLAGELRTNHPALKAAQARTDSAAASVSAVRVWDDPVVKGGVMFADVGMRADEGDMLYGVEQKLPLWGKPRLEKRMAVAEQRREEAQSEYRFQQLRRDLARGLFAAALSEKAIQIGEEDVVWLEAMIAGVEQRYRSGLATQTGLLRLQNDRAKRLDQLATDRQKLEHDHVALNRLLNRNLREPWPRLSLPAPAGPVEFGDRLVELAYQGEPRLKVLAEEVKASEAALEVTRRKSRPDVMVGVENRNYSGSGDWRQTDLMVGLNLPLWNRGKYREEVRRDEARFEASRQERMDSKLALAEEVHLLTVRIDTARREVLIFGGEIAPRSRQAVESARSAWATGQGTLYELLESRRMYLEASWMAARAVAEQYMALSELALCCGLGDLEALQMLHALPGPAVNAASAPQP